MKIVYGAYSDKGSFRVNNEDNFFVGESDFKDPLYVGVVCDGIGGMKDGEVASEAVVEHVRKWCAGVDENASFDQNVMSFLDNIYMINSHIAVQSRVNSIETGTTMSAVLISNDTFMAANVGDSRVYLLNNDIVQITNDDKYPDSNGKRGALRQCLGYSEKMYINTYYGNIQKGNSILICSDGFYKRMDSNALIKKCAGMKKPNEIEKMLKKEIKNLRTLGERDNITACIIHSM